MFSFTDRNILVTGAGSGIGRATALMLGEQGAGVVLVDQNQDTVHSTRDDLQKLGARVTAVVADISNSEAVDTMYAHTVEHYRTLDGIVHCAGTVSYTHLTLPTNREV